MFYKKNHYIKITYYTAIKIFLFMAIVYGNTPSPLTSEKTFPNKTLPFIKKSLLPEEILLKMHCINALIESINAQYGHIYEYCKYGFYPGNSLQINTPLKQESMIVESKQDNNKLSIFHSIIKSIESLIKNNSIQSSLSNILSPEKITHNVENKDLKKFTTSNYYKKWYEMFIEKKNQTIQLPQKAFISNIDFFIEKQKNGITTSEDIEDFNDIDIVQIQYNENNRDLLYANSSQNKLFNTNHYSNIYFSYLLAHELNQLNKKEEAVFINNFLIKIHSTKKKIDDEKYLKKALLTGALAYKELALLLKDLANKEFIDKNLVALIMKQAERKPKKKQTPQNALINHLIKTFGVTAGIALSIYLGNKSGIFNKIDTFITSQNKSWFKEEIYNPIKSDIKKIIKNIIPDTKERFLQWKEDQDILNQIYDIGTASPKNFITNKINNFITKTVTGSTNKAIYETRFYKTPLNFLRTDFFDFSKIADMLIKEEISSRISSPATNFLHNKTLAILGPSFNFLSQNNLFNIIIEKTVNKIYDIYIETPFEELHTIPHSLLLTDKLAHKFNELKKIIHEKIVYSTQQKTEKQRAARTAINYIGKGLVTKNIYDEKLKEFMQRNPTKRQIEKYYYKNNKKIKDINSAQEESLIYAIAHKEFKNEIDDIRNLEYKIKELKQDSLILNEDEKQELENIKKQLTLKNNDLTEKTKLKLNDPQYENIKKQFSHTQEIFKEIAQKNKNSTY
jgi:hypothetical protein